MNPSKDPVQTPGGASKPGPVDPIATTVARHSNQLTQLNTELTQAFATLSQEMSAMKASAQSTTTALNLLGSQVTQLIQAQTPVQPIPNPAPAPDPVHPPPNPIVPLNAPPHSDPRWF